MYIYDLCQVLIQQFVVQYIHLQSSVTQLRQILYLSTDSCTELDQSPPGVNNGMVGRLRLSRE